MSRLCTDSESDPHRKSPDTNSRVPPSLFLSQAFPSAVTPRPNYLRSWKTYTAFGLGAFQIGCNIALLFATIHTYRFGLKVAGDHWVVNDDDIITIIELFSKVLTAVTVLLGGWAMSQHWGRRLCDPTTASGIAELESVDVFRSFVAACRVLVYVIRNRFISSRYLYALFACSSILLQLYSTALVTLAVPTLTFVDHPPQVYHFTPGSSSPTGFMGDYADGGFCTRAPVKNQTYCSSAKLAKNAANDPWVVPPYLSDSHSWSQPMIGYRDNQNYVAGSLLLGPIDNVSFSNGIVSYGLNLASVVAFISFASDGTWDAVKATMRVRTTVPVLTSHCIRDESPAPNVSTLTIQNQVYQLPTTLPFLEQGQAVGYVIGDNNTIVLSFGTSTNESATHCVLDLTLRESMVRIEGRNETQDDSPNLFFVEQDSIPVWNASQTQDSDPYVSKFLNMWLEGIEWGQGPRHSPLAEFLGGLSVAAEWNPDPGSQSNYGPLEYHTLTMLSASASAAFSNDGAWGIQTEGALSITYEVQKQEFFIGKRSPTRYLLMFVIVFESFFVIYCLRVITEQGWLPDWTNPIILVVAALHSGPHSGASDSLHVGKDGKLYPSSEIWESTLTIAEASDGKDSSLSLTLSPSVKDSASDTSTTGENDDRLSLLPSELESLPSFKRL